ncbi:hypothetical protein LBMAG53_25070 [Planctomycetota bacterium]|nr:hypothetical protein LBMAG53_25070 [Planctomycetota bacterium]
MSAVASAKKHTIKVVITGAKNTNATGAVIRHMAFEHAAEIWTPSTNFSSIQGKDQWFYRNRRADGTFIDMMYPTDFKRKGLQWHGEDGSVIRPDSFGVPVRDDVVRSWKAPRDGTVRIQGGGMWANQEVYWNPSLWYVDSENPGPNQDLPPEDISPTDTLNVCIIHNEQQIWSIPLQHRQKLKPVDLLLSVKRGDQLHFIVTSRQKSDAVKP